MLVTYLQSFTLQAEALFGSGLIGFTPKSPIPSAVSSLISQRPRKRGSVSGHSLDPPMTDIFVDRVFGNTSFQSDGLYVLKHESL